MVRYARDCRAGGVAHTALSLSCLCTAGKFERADMLREKYRLELEELYKLDDAESAMVLHGPSSTEAKGASEGGAKVTAQAEGAAGEIGFSFIARVALMIRTCYEPSAGLNGALGKGEEHHQPPISDNDDAGLLSGVPRS